MFGAVNPVKPSCSPVEPRTQKVLLPGFPTPFRPCHDVSDRWSTWTVANGTVSHVRFASLAAQQQEVPAVRLKAVDDTRLKVGCKGRVAVGTLRSRWT